MAKINPKVFWERAESVLQVLDKHSQDPASALFQRDCVVVWSDKNPPEDQIDLEYASTSRISLLLMDGFEFPETLFAFTASPSRKVCISASEKKLKLLAGLQTTSSKPAGVELELVPRVGKDDASSAEAAQRVASFLACTAPTGQLHRQASSSFPRDLAAAMNFEPSPLAVEECVALSQRDHAAIQCTREVCAKLCQVTEKFRKSIPELEDEPKTHAEEFKRVCKQLTSDKDEMDALPLLCAVQSKASGFSAASSTEKITLDEICVQLGAQHKSWPGIVARTVYVDPPTEARDAYSALLRVRDALLLALQPGRKVSEVHALAVAAAAGEGGEGVDAGSLGYALSVGGGSSTATLRIAHDNHLVVRANTLWAVDLKITGNELAHCRIADVVLVTGDAAAEVLTVAAKVDWKRSHFRSQEEGQEEEEKQKKKAEVDVDDDEDGGPPRRRTTTRAQERAQDAQQRVNREQDMGRRQWERICRKRDQALHTTSGAAAAAAAALAAAGAGNKLVNAYDSARELPTSDTMKRDRIHIDGKRECVLLPLGDRVIPLHVSTIKSVSKIEETADSASIRFNLHFPSATSTAAQFKDLPPEMASAIEAFPQLCYIKELTFKSRDVPTVAKLLQGVRDLIKRAKERNRKEVDEGSLVQQAALQLLRERPRDKPATLVDVSMWPSFTGRATVGRLRAHLNGFRFAADKQGDVDVLYDNIKYFFFMRGERELKVCIHCYLHNPIMIGKRKTKHVQFYTEVQEGSSDLQGRGGAGGAYDPDELEDEDRQRRLVQKLNKTFAEFCRQSKSIAQELGGGRELEVETVNSEKQRQRGFVGMPGKEMVLIQPTEHCLVNLSERDPFVLAVDEIEHIHLQRLSIGKIRNFDVVFILKSQLALDRSGDNIKVCKIENVPIEKLDTFRDWIDSHEELTYTCGEAALKWETVLDGVRWELDQGFFWKTEDKEGNKKDFGWLFLNPQGLDDESSDGDEDDSNFSSSGGSDDDEDEEDGSGDEDDSDDLESEVDEDEDDSEDGGGGSGSDEGEDWDELDRKAEAQDKRGKLARRDEEEAERDRKRKKSRH